MGTSSLLLGFPLEIDNLLTTGEDYSSSPFSSFLESKWDYFWDPTDQEAYGKWITLFGDGRDVPLPDDSVMDSRNCGSHVCKQVLSPRGKSLCIHFYFKKSALFTVPVIMDNKTFIKCVCGGLNHAVGGWSINFPLNGLEWGSSCQALRACFQAPLLWPQLGSTCF